MVFMSWSVSYPNVTLGNVTAIIDSVWISYWIHIAFVVNLVGLKGPML